MQVGGSFAPPGLALLVLVLVLVLVAGCATVPPCPARGGPAWRELTSEHFVVRSDLEPDEVVEVVRTLEEIRAAMLTMWVGLLEPIGRTPVIALSSSELAAFAGFEFDGYYFRRPPFPGTVVAAGNTWKRSETVKHELAHELAHHFEPIQPTWYAEGLAMYLETTRYDREKRYSILGEPSEAGTDFFRKGGSPSPADELLGPLPIDLLELTRFYATSWLLTHYLINQRRDAYERFKRRIGALEPGAAAFRAEFPDLDSAGLYSELTKYVSSGHYTMLGRKLPPWVGTPGIRTLPDAEVHGVRAFLYTSLHARDQSPNLIAARAELDEAVSAASPPIEALAVAFYSPDLKYRLGRPELAALAIKNHPESWMAWMMLADASPRQDPAAGVALIRAFGVAPHESEVLVRLAAMKASEGKWDEALALSQTALPAGAHHPELWLIHTAALMRTGHCEEARRWGAALKGLLSVAPGRQLDEVLAGTCLPKGVPVPQETP
jgi:hypothetical protein